MDKRLERLPDDKAFWFCDGTVAYSLEEITEAIDRISDDQFRYHVNDEKNDIANWINHVINDPLLTAKLAPNLSKDQFSEMIKERIHLIKEDENFEN